MGLAPAHDGRGWGGPDGRWQQLSSGCACGRGPALSWMNSPSGNMCLVGLDKKQGLGDAEGDAVLLLFEEHMVHMCVGGMPVFLCPVQ